jgi:putative heme-binding domain-containing protein
LAEAVVALAKVPDAAALKTALTTMARVYKSPLRNTHEGNAARQALLRAPSLDQFVELLDELARHREGDPSAWAEACLISVADNNKASPEARQHAGESLTAGWANGPRRVQILRGITLGELRSWSAKVIASTSDPDKQVAEAARRTAGELRLDLKPLEPSGKLVETLKPEEVLDLVLKQHGDVKRGERWFAQLNCSKCHTVRADEQPRGPFLGQVASIYRRRELAEAVLFPSKTIAQGFSTYQFVLDDGRTVSGFVTVEAADSVTIRDIDGNETRIPNKSIEARAKQPLSMMPEGLVKKIGVNDLASLVDYLESLVKK